MTQDFCVPERGVERIAIRMAPDASSLSIRDAARQILPGIAFAKTGASIVAYLVNDVTRDFRLFQILLALVLLLAAIGVVNATTIAALGRVREIGVLRALGSSRRQLAAHSCSKVSSWVAPRVSWPSRSASRSVDSSCSA